FFTYGTGYPSPRDLRPSPREEEEATEPVTGRRRLGQCPRNRDTSCTVRAGQRTTARIFALHTPQLYQDFARNRELPPCRSGNSAHPFVVRFLLLRPARALLGAQTIAQGYELPRSPARSPRAGSGKLLGIS